MLIPYLIWTCTYLIKEAIFDNVSIKHVIYAFMFGKAAAPFYYIVVLMQLTLLTPWLVKYRRKWMYLITPVYLFFVYAYNIATGSMPILYETLFPAWFFFYLLGMDCKAGRFNKVIEQLHFGWIIVALMISFVEAFILLKLGCADSFASSQIKISSFIYTAVIALFLQKKEKSVGKNRLSTVGDLAYGIFYLHMLVLEIIHKVLTVYELDGIWIVSFGLTFIFTSILSLVVVMIVKKIARKLKCEWVIKYIGFV